MNHSISLEEAAVMTRRFREHSPDVLDKYFKGVFPYSETFDRSAIESLLAKPGCTAIRIYYGMDEDLNLHAILVANNEKNEDILPEESLSGEEDDDFIYERGARCPPICAEPSPLNT